MVVLGGVAFAPCRYVGSLDDKPEVSCVYHSEDAENQFMLDPKRSNLGDGSRPKPGEEPMGGPAFGGQ